MDTVSLTIDGRPIAVDKGKTVLQAAIENGIAVPYYCYHPGIGIDGSCRVCIVKIEKMPKLQTACSPICTEGMIVSNRSPDVVQARPGVFEALHSIRSGNLMDVCPVGAITTRDYRFKSRPWDNPSVADTICTLCEKGCNVNAWIKAKPEWAKGSRLIRFTPRFNPAVNGYWMCDIGRFEYHWVEGDTRLRKPLERTDSGAFAPVHWHELVARLSERLAAAGRSRAGGVQFLVSAHASHEELFLFRRLAEELIGDPGVIHVSWRYREKSQPAGARFLVPPVEAPNVNGA